MSASGWNGILEQGERVLWQGQPDPTPDWSEFDIKDFVFGMVFTGFAVFWIINALGMAPGSSFMGIVFPLFGLPFLVIGLGKAGLGIFWRAYQRRHIWYSLTNQRAFIASDLFGRKSLDAYPIGPATPLAHEEGPPHHIWFATDFVKTAEGSKRRRIGFTHLTESREVFDLMRRLQRELQ